MTRARGAVQRSELIEHAPASLDRIVGGQAAQPFGDLLGREFELADSAISGGRHAQMQRHGRLLVVL
ncbi:MAG: hypothetical protein M5U08_16605 [Burkholderiales bacterium]|nr:hypothetical protein [Burkholderiales bacterium]